MHVLHNRNLRKQVDISHKVFKLLEAERLAIPMLPPLKGRPVHLTGEAARKHEARKGKYEAALAAPYYRRWRNLIRLSKVMVPTVWSEHKFL